MPDKKPVVVYGVSGYTGRLVCEYLREYNIPFIAAGRDKKRVQDVVDKIPGGGNRAAQPFRGARGACQMGGSLSKNAAPGWPGPAPPPAAITRIRPASRTGCSN